MESTELILTMHKDLKGTLDNHGRKIDRIMELSLTNKHEIKHFKSDIDSVKSSQNDFIRKPKPGSFKLWFKIGTFVSAMIVGVYQYFTK